jgi:hypothetical protein
MGRVIAYKSILGPLGLEIEDENLVRIYYPCELESLQFSFHSDVESEVPDVKSHSHP